MDSWRSRIGRIAFSPAIPLLFLLSCLAAILLRHPPVQTAIVQFGEALARRQLTHEVWSARFSSWSTAILTCMVPAVISWAILFICMRIRRTAEFDWYIPFAALGLWAFFYLCALPAYDRRNERLALFIAGAALGLILLTVDGIVRRSGSSSKSWILPALASVLLAALFIDRGQTWGDDFAEYIAQAQVLATGQDNPARPQVGYQYGTALILLPFYKTWGLNLLALKAPMVICFAAFISSIAFFYRKRMQPRNAAAATFLLAVSPALVTYLNNVLSDIPFLLFSSLAVMCFYGVYDRKGGSVRQCLSAAAAGFCVMYAYSCRFQGLILLMAFACTEAMLLLRKTCGKSRLIQAWTDPLSGSRASAHLCLYASFALCFALSRLLLPASPGRSDLGFFDSFSLKGLACNAASYPFFFSEFFACHGLCPMAIRIAAYLVALPLIVLGVMRKGREEAVSVIYSLGLLAVYVIWPGPRDFRFLFPILPFMLLFAAYGYEGLADTGLRRCYKAFFLLVIGVFSCTMLYLGVENLRRGRSGDYQAFSSQAQEAYGYIRENTGTEERIIFFKPRALYLATGRVSAEAEEEEDGFISQLEEYDYLLEFSGQPHGFPLPLKEGLPQGISLEEAFVNAYFTLYRIRRAGR